MLEKMAMCARPSSTSRNGEELAVHLPQVRPVPLLRLEDLLEHRAPAFVGSAFAFAAAAAFSACSSKSCFSSAITPSLMFEPRRGGMCEPRGVLLELCLSPASGPRGCSCGRCAGARARCAAPRCRQCRGRRLG